MRLIVSVSTSFKLRIEMVLRLKHVHTRISRKRTTAVDRQGWAASQFTEDVSLPRETRNAHVKRLDTASSKARTGSLPCHRHLLQQQRQHNQRKH